MKENMSCKNLARMHLDLHSSAIKDERIPFRIGVHGGNR